MLPGFWTPSSHPVSLPVLSRVLQRSVLPGAVISHRTAAELLGVPLPSELRHATSKQLHCTVPTGSRRRCGPRVVVHMRRQEGTRSCTGVLVSDEVSLLCELAADLTFGELVAACDHLVGPRAVRPRLPLAELRRRTDAAGRMNGIKAVREAVLAARERVESPKETEMRLLLAAHGYAEPCVNLTVSEPGTGKTYRIDLAYPRQRIAIEYDGDWHRTDRTRFRRDRRKDDVLHELGWRVVRVVDTDLDSPSEFLARLNHLGAPRT